MLHSRLLNRRSVRGRGFLGGPALPSVCHTLPAGCKKIHEKDILKKKGLETKSDNV